MGNFVGFTGSDFVGTEELGAVSSYVPCFVFGDSMLIGLGIRLGFYLLYGAAIIAVLFGVGEQFRIWNASWAIIALSTLVSIIANATPATLVVVDWAVLIQLVLWYPVFFFLQVFTKHVYQPAGVQRRQSEQEIQDRLQASYVRAITDRDAARVRAYADVLKAFAAHAAEVQAGEDYVAAQANLRDTIETYQTRWVEDISVRDGGHHTEEDVRVERDVTRVLYHPAHLNAIAAAPTRHDLEVLRDNFIAALFDAEGSLEVAHAAEAEATRIANEELQIRRRAMRPRHAAKHLIWGTDIKDKAAAALGLLVWSIWIYASPHAWSANGWLLYGQKAGCPVYFNFLFTPYSITVPTATGGTSSTAFTTFLLVFSCLTIPVAVFTTLFAFWLLAISLFGRRLRIFRTGRTSRRGGRHADVEREQVEDVRDAADYSDYACRQHANEILASIHVAETRDSSYRYRRRVGPQLHFSLFSIPWALTLLILLAYTIGVIQWFLRPPSNPPSSGTGQIKFLTKDMHTTAEIMAFLIGVLVLLLVIWTVIDGFFHLFQARRRSAAAHHRHRHGGKGAVSYQSGSQEASRRHKRE